jgi:dTDP-glucose 4,6-dehydratase
MSYLLITGTAGFIASNLCWHLVDQGYDNIVGVDALLTGSDYNNIVSCPITFLNYDLAEEDQVEAIFRQFDIKQIIHLAAASHVDRSIDDDSPFWRSNVIGTANLCRSAGRHGVDVLINQVTDEAWGCKPKKGALEGDQFFPTSPYPSSKVAQYFVGRTNWITYGLPVISTFPVNCFGPRQYPEKIIPKFTRNLLEGRTVPLMASSHYERDWLPVKDMCRALHLLLEKGEPGQDYNVGADNHHTNLELTRKLLKLTGRDESFIELVPDRKAHDSRYAVIWDKLRHLGWKPECDFDSYLEFTVDWYRHIYESSS